MDREVTSPHRPVQPEGLVPGRGFSHAMVADGGRTVWVAGEVASDADGNIVGDGWVEQFDRTLGNVVKVLHAAGAETDHVVSMQIFTTDVAGYRSALVEVGEAYRRHMGRHYPAMALVGVAELVEPLAVVEIMATAVVPSG